MTGKGNRHNRRWAHEQRYTEAEYTKIRMARHSAHAAFDALWRGEYRRNQLRQQHRLMDRKEAYAFLAHAMGIPEDLCHFAYFDIARCQQAMEIIRNTTPDHIEAFREMRAMAQRSQQP